jgi:putative membrane protein
VRSFDDFSVPNNGCATAQERGATVSDRAVFAWIAVASALILTFLFWLIYGHEPSAVNTNVYPVLPMWNAAFNACAGACLVGGWASIRASNQRRHIGFMLSAVAFSVLFLVTYIVHHATHGDTPFPGSGPIKVAYLCILASHVIVITAAMPMILLTLFYAAKGRFADHRRLARRTLPMWLYASVTGVLVFAILRAYS